MEDFLAASQAELRRASQDYDELFEKFKLAKQLFEERDEVYHAKIRELEESVTMLSRKNNELNSIIKSQNASKEVFAEDVAQLQQVAALLEERETALTAAYENSLREITQKTMEIEDLKDQISRHEHHYKRLQNVMTDSTVPTSEFISQGRKLRDLEESLEKDYVSKDIHEKVVDEFNKIKLQMEKNMVEKSLYETLQQKHLDLERRLPVEYFPVGEYEKLKRILQSAIDEKRLLEESSLVVQEQRDQQLASLREVEAKAVSLKGRVEHQEEEICELRQQKEALSQELLTLRSSHFESEEVRRELRETVRELENAKNHLSTQCGHLKMQLNHELSAKQEAIEARKQVEKQIDQLRHDYNSRIIDSNQKMNDVFEVSEKQYKQRLQEITDHNQRLQAQVHENLQDMDLLHQENERLRSHCRELENLIGDAKMQLTLQLASQETSFRENEFFKQQEQVWKAENDELKQHLQELQTENLQMKDYLEEFRMLVFSELSPTFRKFLVKGEEEIVSNMPIGNGNRSRSDSVKAVGSRWNPAFDGDLALSSHNSTQHHSHSRKDLFHEKMQKYIDQQQKQSYPSNNARQEQTLDLNSTYVSDLSMPTRNPPNSTAARESRYNDHHNSGRQQQPVRVSSQRRQEHSRQFSHSQVNDDVSTLDDDDDNEEEEEVVVIVPRDPNDRPSPPKPALATSAMHRSHSSKINSAPVRSGSALLRVSQTPVANAVGAPTIHSASSPLTPASLPAPPVQQPSPRSLLAHKAITASDPLSTNNKEASDRPVSETGTLLPKTVMQNSARLLRKLGTSPIADNVIPRTASGRNLLHQQVAPPTTSLTVKTPDARDAPGGTTSLENNTKQSVSTAEVNLAKPTLNNSPRPRAKDSPFASPDVVPFAMTRTPSPGKSKYSRHQDYSVDDSLVMNGHHVVASYQQAMR
jgi:hypothetical protein